MTRYVEERRDAFGVEPICRTIGVPVSTHYARRSRKPSRRAVDDRKLMAEIYAAREGYRRVYGVRKTWKELRRRDVDVGRDRVARLMRAEGLEGVRRGKKKRTTVADEALGDRVRFRCPDWCLGSGSGSVRAAPGASRRVEVPAGSPRRVGAGN